MLEDYTPHEYTAEEVLSEMRRKIDSQVNYGEVKLEALRVYGAMEQLVYQAQDEGFGRPDMSPPNPSLEIASLQALQTLVSERLESLALSDAGAACAHRTQAAPDAGHPQDRPTLSDPAGPGSVPGSCQQTGSDSHGQPAASPEGIPPVPLVSQTFESSSSSSFSDAFASPGFDEGGNAPAKGGA